MKWKVGALVVVIVALLFVYRDNVIPLKVKVGISLLGWRGVVDTGLAIAAERVVGMKLTKTREEFYKLLEVFRLFDEKYLTPKRGVVSDDDIAEGIRLLFQLFSVGVDLYDHSDYREPEFRRYVDKDNKFLGDNPDVLYFASGIHPDISYKISGKKSGETYFSATIYTGESAGGYPKNTAFALNDNQIIYNEDETYDIYLLGRNQEFPSSFSAKNVFSLQDGCYTVVTRHYYENSIPAAIDPRVSVNLSIATLSSSFSPSLSPPLPRWKTGGWTDEEVAENIKTITNFIRSHTIDMPGGDPADAPPWFSLVANEIGKPDMHQQKHVETTGGAGAPDIAYSAGPWRLEEGEFLVIEGDVPICRFFNIVLWNRYLQTHDYTHRNISLNREQLGINSNKEGHYKVVVGAENPGNEFFWLDTGGKKAGTVFMRFVFAEENLDEIMDILPSAPKTSLVSLQELKTKNK